jgi:FtsP/CotA-like multicopper oxidase with cupredoxin domain
MSSKSLVLATAAAVALLIHPAHAQAQSFVKCPPYGDTLLRVPELTRDPATKTLKAVMKVSDQQRMVWFPAADSGGSIFCAAQHLRYFQGYSLTNPNENWPVSNGLAEPLPGPTLRARVGDIIEISFFNEVNVNNFPNSLYFDRADRGQGTGCDETAGIYPSNAPGGTINDTYPNCFHGSSTANMHFHGTHTNPGSTGDNVLLEIRPTPRKDGVPVVTEQTYKDAFKTFFDQCEAELQHVPSGWPRLWGQLPEAYRTSQKQLLTDYDTTVTEPHKLWPPNQEALDANEWPEYYIGAYPTCYQLPEYKQKPASPAGLQMGQSPGTQWYHMHKHGSTTLNIANSLIGAFIIEGPYDDQLKDFYKSTADHKNWGLADQVLVIQQVGVTPNLERGSNQQNVEELSINGRRQPVVTMKPGQVQLWRIVNGAHRSGVFFVAPNPSRIQWAQTAQDGVQLNVANYAAPVAGGASNGFLMSAGNRVDLLVRIPAGTPAGKYNIQALDVVKATEMPGGSQQKTPFTLITINVPAASSSDPSPAMPFITPDKFPTFPEFLADIPQPRIHRDLVFMSTGHGAGSNHTINEEKFGNEVSQSMLLNTIEEWKIINETSDAASPGPIMHPFHIHINPFQVVEIFNPWDPTYVFTKTSYVPGKNCFVDPNDRTTWHPCALTTLKAPYVWWDVFAMPGARQEPPDTGPVIKGYFVFRSRFSDYTGKYVLHCHILAHEDRGMMELVEVVPNTTVLKHH